jgi:hypothetical protein
MKGILEYKDIFEVSTNQKVKNGTLVVFWLDK